MVVDSDNTFADATVELLATAWRQKSAARPARSTTSRSSAAARPASRRRSTPLPTASRRSSSSEDVPGGQASHTSLIENFFGFPQGIGGAELARLAGRQAEQFGAELMILSGIRGSREDGADEPDRADRRRRLERPRVGRARGCGMNWRRLELDGVDELLGHGVYYGAGRSEASHCAGERVVVVGAGNSAGQAVLNFANAGAARDDARARRPTRQVHVRVSRRADRAHPAIDVRLETQLTGLDTREGRLAAVTTTDAAGATRDRARDGALPLPRRASAHRAGAPASTSLPTPPASSSPGRISSRRAAAAPRAGRSIAIPAARDEPASGCSRPATCGTARRNVSPAPSARARWPPRSRSAGSPSSASPSSRERPAHRLVSGPQRTARCPGEHSAGRHLRAGHGVARLPGVRRRPAGAGRESSRAIASLREPRTTMGGVNLVAGFRPELWRKVVAGRRAGRARGLQRDVVGADGYVDARDPARRRALALGQRLRRDLRRRARRDRRARGLATVAEETSSWPYQHDRDLTGFIDGSENPTLIDAPELVLDRRGKPGAGGTILLLQKWATTRGVGGALRRAAGAGDRPHKHDSVELDDKPPDSHVAQHRPGQLRQDLPPQHALRDGDRPRHDVRRLQRRPAAARRRCSRAWPGRGRRPRRADALHAAAHRRLLLRPVDRRAAPGRRTELGPRGGFPPRPSAPRLAAARAARRGWARRSRRTARTSPRQAVLRPARQRAAAPADRPRTPRRTRPGPARIQVPGILVVRGLARVLGGKPHERLFYPRPLGGRQLACSFGLHGAERIAAGCGGRHSVGAWIESSATFEW